MKSKLPQRFTRDESGIALPLAVIMVVLIGVMGAGLLTFVTTDLTNVLSVNQGQRAFEMADAGVQAAKRQLTSDPKTSDYDGSGTVGTSNESQWSWKTNGSTNGVILNDLDGSSATNDSVTVTIQYVSAYSFKVISTGHYEDAKRKVEAVYKVTPGISNSIPAAVFTWSDIHQNGGGGGCNLDGTSMFAMGDASFGGSFNVCSTPDQAYGKWAKISGAGPYPNSLGSYPNLYNSTPRSSCSRAGIAARGTISPKGNIALGTCDFDKNTTPAVVSGPPANSNQIAFPFGVASSPPASDLEALRQRALELEKQNPGSKYYIDSNPGNGQDDAALTTDQSINSWPTGSDYQTVVFYKFATSGKQVSWNIRSGCSPTDTNKGVIAVENGDFSIGSNNGGFNGTVVIRGGSFNSSGNSCMTGYVNSSGDINMGGGSGAGTVPPLTSLPAFRSSKTDLQSWWELYQ